MSGKYGFFASGIKGAGLFFLLGADKIVEPLHNLTNGRVDLSSLTLSGIGALTYATGDYIYGRIRNREDRDRMRRMKNELKREVGGYMRSLDRRMEDLGKQVTAYTRAMEDVRKNVNDTRTRERQH